MKTRIISAFPCCGKTYLFNNPQGRVIADSDSSEFSWVKDSEGNNTKERNPNFPTNYIDYIKSLIGKVDYILVSSHDDIRHALDEAQLCWIAVTPDESLMNEWVGRCYMRGSSDSFIKILAKNWKSWTNWQSINMNFNNSGQCIIESNKYLSDELHWIETLCYNE
jgi:hypothetical protein